MDLKQHIISTVEQKIHERVPGMIRRVSGNRLNLRCPLCGDSANKRNIRRGWFFLETGIYKCYNEGCPAFDKALGPIKFYSLLTNQSYDSAKMEIFSWLKEISRDSLYAAVESARGGGSVVSTCGSKIELPPEEKEYELRETWVPLKESEAAVKFLESRKIFNAPFLPKGYRIYYDFERKKIVLPWFRDGRMMSFQYRTMAVDDPQKYTFPINSKKDVFGIEGIDHDFRPVLYTEGVLDAIFCKNCLAIGGIHPSESQMAIMSNYLLDHDLVFFPDNPWVDQSSRREILKFADENPNGLVFLWEKDNPYKDLNDEAKATGNFTKYSDPDWLNKRIVKATAAKISLVFGRDFL